MHAESPTQNQGAYRAHDAAMLMLFFLCRVSTSRCQIARRSARVFMALSRCRSFPKTAVIVTARRKAEVRAGEGDVLVALGIKGLVDIILPLFVVQAQEKTSSRVAGVSPSWIFGKPLCPARIVPLILAL